MGKIEDLLKKPRIHILKFLIDHGEIRAHTLAEHMKLSDLQTKRHLDALITEKLVYTFKVGRLKYYKIKSGRRVAALKFLFDNWKNIQTLDLNQDELPSHARAGE